MRFYLVSASDPSVKEEVDIPEEIVVNAKNKQKLTPKAPKARGQRKNRKKKTIQSSKSVIVRHGSAHHRNKRTSKSM